MGRFIALACLTMLFAANSSQAQDKIRVAELSPRAEAAIEKGLKFLEKSQNASGSWGDNHQVAVTSLSLMAYMVKGHFPDREPYGKTMTKGLDFLLKQVRLNKGYLGTSMYEHGLATLALSEVWGETTRTDEVRDALKTCVSVIVKNQHQNKGGWGYYPDGGVGRPDMSLTVMQIVALASAKEAGILVPDDTMKRAITYVKSCQNTVGSFGYTQADGNGGSQAFARTGAGVMSLMMSGARNSDEAKRGVAFLHDLGDRPFHQSHPWFYYGHYYAVQAMYQASEKDYQAWYPKIRDTLVSDQSADGSWKASGLGGDKYCTPMAILILGVPYRYLPIYQR